MRKFTIVGKTTGASFDMNNTTYLIYAPKNLGVKFKNEYLKVFNTRFKVESRQEFEDFNCMLLIKNYERYENFRNFVSKNIKDGFLLFYSPYPDIERYIECDVAELGKDELNKDGTLRCKFVITPRSYWKKEQQSLTNFTEANGIGKFYALDATESGLFDYNYGFIEDPSEVVNLFSYNYIYADVGINEAFLINNGDYETSLKITLNGAFINPYIRLVDVNENIVQEARFLLEVANGEKLIVNSSPADLQVTLVNNVGQAIDKTGVQDFSKTTYITLPVGEFTLRISEDNESTIVGQIEYAINYTGG